MGSSALTWASSAGKLVLATNAKCSRSLANATFFRRRTGDRYGSRGAITTREERRPHQAGLSLLHIAQRQCSWKMGARAWLLSARATRVLRRRHDGGITRRQRTRFSAPLKRDDVCRRRARSIAAILLKRGNGFGYDRLFIRAISRRLPTPTDERTPVHRARGRNRLRWARFMI